MFSNTGANAGRANERKVFNRPDAKATIGYFDTLDGDRLIAAGDLETQRLADLSKQDYTLEPNQHFTPDGQAVGGFLCP